MTAFRRLILLADASRRATRDSAAVFLRDVGQGMLEIGHNTLALVGLVLVATVLFAASHTELRQTAEAHVLGWLQSRQEVPPEPEPSLASQLREPDAVARATAYNPKDLNRQQAAVAHWIARRYRVAPEPISRLVLEAWQVGARAGLDPTLILAIMAIESSFNPFAQSNMGAQGLMQVITTLHDDKYVAFGGQRAAFDPVTNLRVGVLVLKECISRAGSVELGLRYYVGAANLPDDGGYAAKVLAEQNHMREVAGGKPVPTTALTSTPNRTSSQGAKGAVPQPAPTAPAVPETPASPQELPAVEFVAMRG